MRTPSTVVHGQPLDRQPRALRGGRAHVQPRIGWERTTVPPRHEQLRLGLPAHRHREQRRVVFLQPRMYVPAVIVNVELTATGDLSLFIGTGVKGNHSQGRWRAVGSTHRGVGAREPRVGAPRRRVLHQASFFHGLEPIFTGCDELCVLILRQSIVKANTYRGFKGDDSSSTTWNPVPVTATIEFRGMQATYTFPVGTSLSELIVAHE